MLRIDLPSRTELESLLRERGSALVSIYLPTSPLTQQAQADRLVLKNLTDEVLNQLVDHDKREVRAISELLFDLIDDDTFWRFQANSLAVFVSPAHLVTFRLANRLQPLVEVSDRFHVKPLLRAVTAPQSAFVLALSQNSARVIEVSPDLPAEEVPIADLPTDAASAVRKASIKDRSPSGRLQGAEGEKVRLVQYARQVDQSLRNSLLAGRETPVILAAAEPLRSIYRSVQSYPHLAATTIDTNPDAMSAAELAAAARGILDELFAAEVAAIADLFGQREPQGRTTTDVAQAARAATYGAVQTLLVDIDEVVPGEIDENGSVTFGETAGHANYGIVDEIARRAFESGARVLAVRRADIPRGGSLAAILRYAF